MAFFIGGIVFKQLSNEKVFQAEEAQRQYWDDINLLQETLDTREGAENFVFYDGPPTANGRPGLHHVVSRSLKDAVCRYKHMQGYLVRRKAGWDTHGLPVEIEVEKKLDLHDKKDIEAYGIGPFNDKCRASVFEYESYWRKMTEEMAYLIDMDNPYITLDNNYIETVWWLLKEFFDKGLVYEGFKILPYCSRCGTGLASHEVAQGYKEVKQETVVVTFKRKDAEEYFLVWTTTPWTLASNVLLTVHPEHTYAKVRQEGRVYIIAKALAQKVMGEDIEILEEFPGKDLEYVEYEPIMDFVKPDKKAYFVTLGDYVTLEDGTGIVHTAPAFGEDDYNLGKKYDAPVLQPVNEEGRYTTTPWEGMFVMDADPDIVQWLREQGKLYKKQRMDHNYPHCWRCDTPLLYYAHPSWYIETTKLRDQLVANNKTVNWYPPHIGEKRFGNWLENIKDWAISRSRYWGTPLNIWTCSCGHKEAIGSREELRARSKQELGEIELHRPFVDDITFDCPKCQGEMHRVPYVLDVWFDSGAMPFAQMHYPFEHKDDFENYFPADFICEGIDQTRGWFYSMMAISTGIMNKAPYKNVLVNDMLLDKDGKKMSKSKGNVIDPFELFKDYGADAVRWYLSYSSPAWAPTKFDFGGLREVISKFFSTLKNSYNLFILYANLSDITPENINDLWIPVEERPELDRWIMSRLHETLKTVKEQFDVYDLTQVTRILQDFVNEELSNWYIRRSRRRFWQEELTEDKKSVFITTYEVLKTIVLMAAPIAPFITEEIYRNLTGEKSVHLADYPEVNESLIDRQLNESMKLAQNITTLGRAAREAVSIKVRQPLPKVVIDKRFEEVVGGLTPVIKEELNVKEVAFIDDLGEYLNFIIKPNFPVLGPKLGPKMGLFQKELKAMDAAEVASTLRNGGSVAVELEGETLNLTSEELDIKVESKEQFTVQTLDDLFVILDVNISEELRDEGYAREFISSIQQMRKANDFEVSDHITIEYHGTEAFEKAIQKHEAFIMSETLADEINVKDGDFEAVTLNGQETFIQLKKVQ